MDDLYNRRVVEEVVPVETMIWNCVAENCIAWVRDNFKNAEIPTCPICNSEMIQGTRMLPAVENPLKMN